MFISLCPFPPGPFVIQESIVNEFEMKAWECGTQEPRSCELYLLTACEITKQEGLPFAMGGSSGKYSLLIKVLRISGYRGGLVPKEDICITSHQPQGAAWKRGGKSVWARAWEGMLWNTGSWIWNGCFTYELRAAMTTCMWHTRYWVHQDPIIDQGRPHRATSPWGVISSRCFLGMESHIPQCCCHC